MSIDQFYFCWRKFTTKFTVLTICILIWKRDRCFSLNTLKNLHVMGCCRFEVLTSLNEYLSLSLTLPLFFSFFLSPSLSFLLSLSLSLSLSISLSLSLPLSISLCSRLALRFSKSRRKHFSGSGNGNGELFWETRNNFWFKVPISIRRSLGFTDEWIQRKKYIGHWELLPQTRNYQKPIAHSRWMPLRLYLLPLLSPPEGGTRLPGGMCHTGSAQPWAGSKLPHQATPKLRFSEENGPEGPLYSHKGRGVRWAGGWGG